MGKFNKPRLYFIIFIIFIFLIAFFSLYNYNNPKLIDLQLIEIKEDKTFFLQPQPISNHLFGLKFKYLINSSTCNNSSNISAVIIVTSYYGNIETRSAMRRAFPLQNLLQLNLRRVFLLGTVPNDIYIKQNSIDDESKRFGDIVQGNFQEAYRNLTYKHMMGLKWVSESCNTAKYVIKMDDDIVVNYYKLAEVLKGFEKFPGRNNSLLLAGYILRGMTPIREPANKWYVTEEEYKYAGYPPFLSGWFYVTTSEVCRKFVALSYQTKYFWIDDVYVSGLLARKLRIKHFDLSKYFTTHPDFLKCCMGNAKKFVDCHILVGPNGGDSNLFYEFNTIMRNCHVNTCRKPDTNLNETCTTEKQVSLLRKGNAIIENYRLH